MDADDAELTIQEAADFLNVSPPYVIEQIEHGKLPVRTVDGDRRVLFSDLIEYEKQVREGQMKALEELNSEARRLGLE